MGEETAGSRTNVAQVSAALLQAVNRSDVPGILAVWCDDGMLMPPHHPSVRSRAAIAEYFQRLFLRGRFEFAFTASEIEVAGDLAFERVEYASSFWPADGGHETRDVGKGLHVFRRQAGGEWRLLMDIWNVDSQ